MANILNIIKRISPLLLLICLLIVVLPWPVVAQEKYDLSIRLISRNYYADVEAGKDNPFFLEVRNFGTAAINNIKLSAEAPEGWLVQIQPATISRIEAGSLQAVNINITPISNAVKRDYQLNIIADTDEIRKVESVYVRVEAGSFWLWIGAAVVALVIAGFIFIYIRFGRH